MKGEPPRNAGRKRGPAKRNPNTEAADLEQRADTLMKTAAVLQGQAMRLMTRAAVLREGAQ